MKPFDPDKETGIQYIARLEATVNRLLNERKKLDRRIHNQRVALRENWMIVERRASYRRAWIRSPLLMSMLRKGKLRPWYQRVADAIINR